eukprot:TRINITY_DN1365_c0_g1_i1.p1 TRINITY_DN1365_c0_g1~~TRINITY_DN1365_c0_g1_i1.p1  ORF type:complete len:309 (-),score=73.71 TRINITY_DN1365_c0_g1_i1:115-1041(-)
MSLKGKTLFITGASRGIGLAIALRAAKDGANIIIAAKTADAHPKLPGTIYSAAREIEEAGGRALPCIVDVRSEEQVKAAVDKAVEVFGGIDIVVNNASAISLTNIDETDMKKYDLMNQINARGTYLVTKVCLPHLRRSSNPHVLILSPPLDVRAKWFRGHVAYSLAKFGMSLCALGLHAELRGDGIAVNTLWPRTVVGTAATAMLGGESLTQDARVPAVMADAAYLMLTQDSRAFTGRFCIDDDVLRVIGGLADKDFARYLPHPDANPSTDLFVDEPDATADHDDFPANLDLKNLTLQTIGLHRFSRL